jgi:hypothetical protein
LFQSQKGPVLTASGLLLKIVSGWFPDNSILDSLNSHVFSVEHTWRTVLQCRGWLLEASASRAGLLAENSSRNCDGMTRLLGRDFSLSHVVARAFRRVDGHGQRDASEPDLDGKSGSR